MSTYSGQPITEGILAGYKIAALKQELQMNALQQAEFQEFAGHRQRMAGIQEALGQSELESNSIAQQLAKLQLGEQTATSGSRIETANLAPEKVKADIGEAKGRGELFGAEARKTMLDNVLHESELAKSTGATAAGAGMTLTDAEISALAESAMNQAGVKYKPGDATHALWQMGIKSSFNETKRQLADLQAKNQGLASQHIADTLHMLQDTMSKSTDPTTTANILAEQFKDDPILAKLAPVAANAELKSRQSASNAGYEDRTNAFIQSHADKMLTPLYEKLSLVTGQISDLESQQENGEKYSKNQKGYIYNGLPIDKELKPLYAQQKNLKKQINDIKDELFPKVESKKPAEKKGGDFFSTTNSAFGPAELDLGPVTIKTQDEYNKLKSGTVFIGPDGKRYTKP